MGLDPGFRTGVKVAVVDATGKVVATDSDLSARRRSGRWEDVAGHAGRGSRASTGSTWSPSATAPPRGRPTSLAAELDRRRPPAAADQDRGLRGGRVGVLGVRVRVARNCPSWTSRCAGRVSIARRLQDPLAELVKIDPKSIGVGQYQHDLSELPAVAVAGRRRRGLRERRRRRREHRVRAAAVAGVRDQRRAWPRTSSPTGMPTARSAPAPALQDVPRLGAQGVRAVRRLPAHPAATIRWTPPPCTRRPTRWCAGSSRRRGEADGGRADRQHRGAARPAPAGLRQRHLRPADRHRHPARSWRNPAATRARRSPPRRSREGVEKIGDLQRRHGAGRGGHERGGLRRLRRRRRATRTDWCTSRRCRRRFVKDPRDGGQVRRHREGEGAGRRREPRKRISLTLRLDDEPGAGRAGQRPPATGQRPPATGQGQSRGQGQGRGRGQGRSTAEPTGAMAEALRRAGLDPGARRDGR